MRKTFFGDLIEAHRQEKSLEKTHPPVCFILVLTIQRKILTVLYNGSANDSPTEVIMKARGSQETHFYRIIPLIVGIKARCICSAQFLLSGTKVSFRRFTVAADA